jgi:DNA-binding transcriptional regulator YbjK
MTTANRFSAADSAIGYLYQVRVALLWALRRLKRSSNFVISLETLDDVTFENKNGKPEELLQTKHHRNREATLTDASADLWKSLRIWFDGFSKKSILTETALYLLTTGRAPNGSIASYLRTYGRDIDAAIKGLEATAMSSSSKENAEAYAAFISASTSDRKKLVECIVVLDAAPTIASIDDELKSEIYWAVDRKNHNMFLERLEGWWLRRTIAQLTSVALSGRILAEEIELEMSDLREQFKQDSLPIDDDLLRFDLDDATQAMHADSVFVRQLNIINAGKRRIAAAVRDYYRAGEQRSRWLRNDLLLIGDLQKYEQRLKQEWELVFEQVKDELGADAAEEVKQISARKVLSWAENTSLPIRPHVTEPFVARGSLHMLADDVQLGWHPEFRDRLAILLGFKEAIA